MRKRIALGFVVAALSVGMLPAPASAGQYCERADEVSPEAGFACRAALGTALGACSKVAEKWGNECQLG